MAERTKTVRLPAQEVPVIATPDVCVIGGGAAGLAAAVAAGRLGLKVLLVERHGFCGGATVAGLSGTICGLHSSGDTPEQIVFGFAGEFYQALRQAGGVAKPVPFGRTLLVPHDSFVWKETADRFLRENNIRVLYHTLFLDAFAGADGSVETLLLRCLEGPVAIQPRCVIDASGDAEVVHRLGGQTHLGKNGIVQTPTMIFRMGGVDMPRFLKLDPREIDTQVAAAHQAGRYHLPRHHVYIFPMPNGREVLCNMTRITFPDGSVPLGIRSDDMTFAEIEGRIQARSYARFLCENIPAFEHAYLVETGAQVGIRQTRSITGQMTLTNAQVLKAAKFPGAATFSAWPIEAHGAGELQIVYFNRQTYDIPFETLIPQHSRNLLVAGRCLSAEHEALASARVTAQCFGMGYAAGAACGLMVRESILAQNLTGVMVAEWMQKHNLKSAGER
ncbi:MAG: FAD-dependent oxidoreductase [Verrucomicrobiota bacterium]